MHRSLRHICGATLVVALAAITPAMPASAVTPSPGQQVAAQDAAARFVGHDVFTTLEVIDARRFYIAPREGGNGITHIATNAALPWGVSVDYTLDGPSATGAQVHGAKGMVGIHVHIQPNNLAQGDMQRFARQLRPVVVFTIPTRDCTDISADEGVSLTQSGQSTVVAATANPGEAVDFRVYADAKRFSMSPVALAALSADTPDHYASALRTLADQSGRLTSSIDADASAQTANGAHAELIATLATLRDQERALAKSTIEERTASHQRAFHDYMAAYVGSYTNHLSGSIGTKTQLSALMGTAGELKGDTPLAHAVTGLATAVNELSDAHQHTGAADEVDRIIQRIRQQGTQGLAEELKKTAGEQTRIGAKEYSAGQSQLSQAMIPYSMAYTDAYTAHLDTLAGGNVGAAAQFEQQAIEQTNADNATDPTLSGDMQGVNAAMATLASAREHTGAGSAARQVLLRFSGRFGGDSAGTDGVEPINEMQPALRHSPLAQQAYRDWYTYSIGGRAEMLRAKRIAAARAEEQKARSANGGDDMSTLVSVSNDDASADVAKYAGSVTKSLGGGDSTATAQGGGSATHTGGGSIPESERLATQLGYSGLANHQLIVPSTQHLIDETVQIGSMAQALSAAANAMGADGALGRQVAASGAVQAGEASALDSRMVIVTNPLR
ncbi:tubuliform spidroin [Bifidobacterium pseudolongum subsp. globosum]|uniref:tubuliform spidroin n=1 Tax=Bifidobacterium pseudolongum TaxID=1694 RepID=UPI0010208FE9|nr:tubuliform spidroin [Bifidobacterium pseudolongum]RYQ03489.1 tubuliform spidroin [Bifidobacterium pseudolongum subsp. globosum]RYQ08790.1 tubuliform spidroin [Bifidobacterium pseudolongum subsp. globosum]RYQ12584.1 tubuliform spidroin [Bifidobacterium pseudolongum subsp. globosum]RYQ14879.1 tubuliform spidroin [Bifidobacterium pseudolongum subsp. globosum]